MKKFSVGGLILSLVLLSYLILFDRQEVEADFESKDFQNHVFNTNVLFRTTGLEPGYFSGTLLTANNTTYILTCCHGLEEISNISDLEAVSFKYSTEGLVYEEKLLPIKLLLFSPSEENGGIDLAIFEVTEDAPPIGNAILKNIKLRPMDKIVCIGNAYGKYSYSVYEGSVTKQCINLRDTWTEPFFITSCEVRQGCSGGGVFTKKKGKYYYCGMITRSDLRGTGMFKPFSVIEKWLVDNDMSFIVKEA